MPFDLRPRLSDSHVRLEPLAGDEFESLYAVASDPLIWEQHPNKDRYQRPVFETFFKGALESKGAFKVFDAATGALIGSTRFVDYDEAGRLISIGYTFLARSHWGGPYNRAMKTLMLDHAFRFVERVTFQVGVDNWRSRKAMEKLGGVNVGEKPISYYGEPP